jgi:hypothetical protein
MKGIGSGVLVMTWGDIKIQSTSWASACSYKAGNGLADPRRKNGTGILRPVHTRIDFRTTKVAARQHFRRAAQIHRKASYFGCMTTKSYFGCQQGSNLGKT